jgi:hypothetical protein
MFSWDYAFIVLTMLRLLCAECFRQGWRGENLVGYERNMKEKYVSKAWIQLRIDHENHNGENIERSYL